MKKLISLLCMLTCIFSLTACGANDEVNPYQVDKQAFAEQYAVESIIPLMTESVATEEVLELYHANAYTPKEWETVVTNAFSLTVDGEAYLKAMESFLTGLEKMGGILELGSVSSVVSDEEIIVYVDVLGEIKDGQIEIILSNDYFGELKSCTLNVNATFEEKMTNAGLNTLLGMGTVFAVLIFIMLIIYAFGIIPAIQKKLANKDKAQAKVTKKTPAKAKEEDLELVAAIAAATAYEESKNDTELVAVIAAAVAAYRGETTTDNFVVRSIKKIKRR